MQKKREKEKKETEREKESPLIIIINSIITRSTPSCLWFVARFHLQTRVGNSSIETTIMLFENTRIHTWVESGPPMVTMAQTNNKLDT